MTTNEATQLMQDNRAQHYWDEDKSLGLSFGKIVTLPRERTLAVEWQDQPPMPADWMHQLGIDEKTLDGEKLRMSVQRIVGNKNELPGGD